MSLQTAMLATLIVVIGVAQYALCVQALRDLARRPRVRGDNKALWALWILCVPIVGAMLYNWMGPTSFVGRRSMAEPMIPESRTPAASNITSISSARAARRRGSPTASQATRPQPPTRQPGASPRGRRTGS